ncbi:MAG: hypothetical protein R3D69_11860 [Xanthobacteraceae bacterium]
MARRAVQPCSASSGDGRRRRAQILDRNDTVRKRSLRRQRQHIHLDIAAEDILGDATEIVGIERVGDVPGEFVAERRQKLGDGD